MLARFGFPVPTRGALGILESVHRLGRAADEYNYDSIWITDQIVLPKPTTCKYPYSPNGSLGLGAMAHYLDALTVMSFLTTDGAASAARTPLIGTCDQIVEDIRAYQRVGVCP